MSGFWHYLVLHRIWAWMALSGLINVALDIKPLGQWVNDAEKRPRIKAVADALSAVGLDPVALLSSLIVAIRGKAKEAPSSLERSDKGGPEVR